jgi:hypothetical protein
MLVKISRFEATVLTLYFDDMLLCYTDNDFSTCLQTRDDEKWMKHSLG